MAYQCFIKKNGSDSDNELFLQMRLVIVGTSASGKTTCAKHLAQQLGIPHIELDALHWKPNWTPASLDEFRLNTECAVSQEHWTLDGNYKQVRDIVWPRATHVVWLDYSFPRVFWQVIKRSTRRLTTREVLWSGNRESWKMTFLSQDSILLWVLTTYWKRRKEYPLLLASQEYSHLEIVRLRTPRETNDWMERLRVT